MWYKFNSLYIYIWYTGIYSLLWSNFSCTEVNGTSTVKELGIVLVYCRQCKVKCAQFCICYCTMSGKQAEDVSGIDHISNQGLNVHVILQWAFGKTE